MKRSCACAARAAKSIRCTSMARRSRPLPSRSWTPRRSTRRACSAPFTRRARSRSISRSKAARAAAREWAHRSVEERITPLRRAAELIRERKFDLAATMSVEVGKSRLEAMGDAEESADLIDYYCQQMIDANGFVREMAKMTPIEHNIDVLRPFGVSRLHRALQFSARALGRMSSAALVAGNTIVYKPAEEAPWTGLKLYEIYRDAGIRRACSISCRATGTSWATRSGVIPASTGWCSRARRKSGCASSRNSARR